MAEGIERRQSARVEIDAFVKVGDGDREYVFRTRDISATGLFLYTKVGHIYPFGIGSKLTIELYDYDQFVELHTEVIRVVEEGTSESEKFPLGFGLRIVSMSDEAKASLERMIARASQGKPPY